MEFTFSFVFALGAAIFIALCDLAEPYKKHPLTIGVVTLVVNFLLNWASIYFIMPAFVHPLSGGYALLGVMDLVVALVISALVSSMEDGREWKGTGAATGFVLLGLVVYFAVGCLATPPAAICDNNGNSQMAALLNVRDYPSGFAHKDNDLGKLVKVSPRNALLRASRSIGGDANIGSYLEVNRAYLQDVKGYAYYIVDLKVKDWRSFNSKGGIIPGYIVVDALDPNKEPEFRTGYAMKYVPGAPWGDDLVRKVYLEFLLGSPWTIDDLDELEVTEDWLPIYTGTLLRPAVGFQGYKVDGVITVDPQTGKITPYAVGQQPKWVNRLWSMGYVQGLGVWWGRYYEHKDCPWQGDAGIREIDRVNDVFGQDGQKYQITYTSKGVDQSLTEMLTVDPLTGDAFRSKVTGATIQAVEKMVEEATKRETAEGFDAVECELQTLLGQDVWYCILEGRGAGDEKSAGGLNGFAFVQMKHSATSQTSKVIMGDSLNEAYIALRSQIASETGDNPDLAATTQTVQISGTVERKGEVDIEGKKYGVFTLTGQDVPQRVVFRVSPNNTVFALMRPGEVITVTAIAVVFDSYTDVIDIKHGEVPNYEGR